MSGPESNLHRDPIDELAEEFAERLRRGEQPSIEKYTCQHPQWAERIQQVFSALIVMERLKPQSEDAHAARAEADSAARPLHQPERIGDYRVLREVGRGGMGVVYEAEQSSLGRHVALKVLQSGAVMEPKHIARFEREARAAAQLHHTNIVPVFGVGCEGNLHYYVMQFIQGQPLDDVLAELNWLRKERSSTGTIPIPDRCAEGDPREYDKSRAAEIAVGLLSGQFTAETAQPPPTRTATSSSRQNDSAAVLPGETEVSTVTHSDATYWQCVARLGLQVATALDYAHEQGILHRDIKPANLLLDHHGTVWVTDFGLAKVIQEDQLTQTGDVVGTLRYMAPEAFRGKYELRSDIYGLGLTLYEMIALRPAFDAIDRSTLMRQVTSGEIPRLRKVNSNVPRDLDTIIMKALEHQPVHRYADGRRMSEDLQRFLDDKPIRARRASGVERAWRWSRRNPALAASLATVAALLVFLAVAGQLVARKQTALATQETAAREAFRRTLYISDMNQAVEAWDNADLPRLLMLLDRHRPTDGQKDLRGFEWYHLMRNYERALADAGLDHDAPVGGASFSPDGKTLATAAGNTIWLWDVATRKRRGSLTGHTGDITALAFSPDGTTIASGGADLTVILWDVPTGKQHFVLHGHSRYVRGVAFSPDGESLVSVSWNEILRWDVTTGHEQQRLAGNTGPRLSVAFSSDGTIALGGRRRVILWNAAEPERIEQSLLGYRTHIDCIAFSGDDKWLAFCVNETAVLWNRDERRNQATLKGHLAPILSIAFSPKSSMLATGSVDGTVRLWDVETGMEMATFKGHKAQINCVSFSPDGAYVASGSDDSTVRLWNSDRRDPDNLEGYQAIVEKLVFSPDGKTLATVSYEHPSLALCDIASGRIEPLTEQNEWLSCLLFSRDGNRLFVGAGSSLRIWDVAKRGEIKELAQTHEGDITGMACSPDGTILVTATRAERGTLKVWDTKTWDHMVTLDDYESHFGGLAFSPDGRILAAPAPDHSVTLYEVSSWRKVGALKGHTNQVQGLSFSPNGGTLASASSDATVRLWDVANRRELATLTGHRSHVYGVAFSPKGNTVVSVGRDATVRVWNLNFQPPQMAASLRGHSSSVVCAQFSPHGRTLATSSMTGTVRLWRAANEDTLDAILDARR